MCPRQRSGSLADRPGRRETRAKHMQTYGNIWKHMETYAKTRWIKMEDAEYSSYTAHQSHQACHSAQKLTRNGITLAFPLSVLNLGQEPSHNVEHPRTLLNIHQTSGGQLGMSFCTIDHIKWCIMVSFCSTSVLPDSFLWFQHFLQGAAKHRKSTVAIEYLETCKVQEDNEQKLFSSVC